MLSFIVNVSRHNSLYFSPAASGRRAQAALYRPVFSKVAFSESSVEHIPAACIYCTCTYSRKPLRFNFTNVNIFHKHFLAKNQLPTYAIFLIPEKVTCTDESGIQHEPGDAFNDNRCESRCTCTENGDIVCQPLNCPTGLIRRGNK